MRPEINKPNVLSYSSAPPMQTQVPDRFMPNFQQMSRTPPPQGISMQDWLEFQGRGNPITPEQKQQLGQIPIAQQAPQLQTFAPAATVVAQEQAQTVPLTAPPIAARAEVPQDYAMPYTTPAEPVAATPVNPSALEEFVMGFEKFSPEAYDDYGQKSIGYGIKARDTDTGAITEAEARSRLQERLASDRAIVEQFGKKHGYDWKDNQIDALTSFVYNLGPKALAQVTANGSRSLEELPEYMKLYYNAGGKKLKGLEKRRNAEADWYNS